jgi:hypothetical protein
MSEERKKILSMLAEGKISVDEAERLLEAIGEGAKGSDTKMSHAGKETTPKYLRVEVDGHDSETGKPEKVNVKIPLQLLRAGLKLHSILPNHAHHKIHDALHEKGMNFDLKNLKPESMEELITALSDLTVDVNGEADKVRIYCE